MIAIFWKEMADHFGRRRFVFLLALVFLAIIWALSVIFGTVEKAASSREEFLFLRVFSSSSDVLPSLLFFISFFGPLAGIILGSTASIANGPRAHWPGSCPSPCTGMRCTTESFWQDLPP